MGRFSGKSSAAAKAKRDFIKVNPYEIPEKALEVISNICQKTNTDDATLILSTLRKELEKKGKNGQNFYEFIETYRKDLYDMDLVYQIRDLLGKLFTELLAHENTNDTQVVVAGGFSAGKSSFLNTLTGAGNLLPTGIDPVSMVSTYLYCSAKTTDIVVKGINLKDAVVLLDTDILQSIQHESKSKVYLASVLNKLFVEIPSKDLDGFVFIDTPGYNNSDKKNETNNRTDEETALSAVNSGNVLLWVVDAGGGTVPKKDLEIISNFLNEKEGRKVAIVFNKADKKGEIESKKIVRDAAAQLSKFGAGIIDILAFSSSENRIYYSANGYDMPKLLRILRSSGTGNSGVQRLLEDIEEILDMETMFANAAIRGYEEEKQELIDRKNEAYKYLHDEKEGSKTYVEALTDIMVDSYNHIMGKLDGLDTIATDSLNHWSDSISDIRSTNNGNFITQDNIDRLLAKASTRLNSDIDKFSNARQYTYWRDEDRAEWVDRVKIQLDRLDSQTEEQCENLENQINETNKEILKYKHIAQQMDHYRDTIKHTLMYAIKTFRQSAHKVQDARLNLDSTSDVFMAIRSGKYSTFTSCFAKGVKLNQFNAEGYSPLTYSVKMGAYDMVRFLIENDANLSANDGRGLNAFLTAVENGHKHIIDMLLKVEPSLSSSTSDKGEDAKKIVERSDFNRWLVNKL